MRLKYCRNPRKRATHPPLCAPGSAGSWLRNSIPSRPQCCQRSLSQASAHQTSPLHRCGSGCHKCTALCSHPTVLQTSHLTLQEKIGRLHKKTITKEKEQILKPQIIKEEPSRSPPAVSLLYSWETQSTETIMQLVWGHQKRSCVNGMWGWTQSFWFRPFPLTFQAIEECYIKVPLGASACRMS